MKKRIFAAGTLALCTAVCCVAADVITDAAEKKNYGVGRETAIRDIAGLRAAAGVSDAKTPYIVLLSDLHVYSAKDAGKSGDVVYSKNISADLRQLAQTIRAFSPAPAMVVITGDLAHEGKPDQYAQVKDFLNLIGPGIPVMAVPGNQDDRTAMAAALDKNVIGTPVRRLGGWTLIGLDSGRTGTPEAAENSLLRRAVADAGNRPILILTHHTPVQQPGWEPVRELREMLAVAAGRHEQTVWLLSGHAHANFLMRMRYEGLKDIPVLTHTSSTSSYGYDAPALRVLFLDDKTVAASAILRYADSAAGFRIDPPPADWPIYAPPARDGRIVVLDIDRAGRGELAVERKGVGEHERYDYIDGDGCLRLAIPLASYAENAPLVLELDLESDFIVKVGESEGKLRAILNSGKRVERKRYEYPIPAEWTHGLLFLEIRDRTPQDGFGAFIHGIRLKGRETK